MKRTKLTFKQKLFAKKYVETNGNGTQSALAVYDTKSQVTAADIASENLSKPYIAQEIQSILNSKGLGLNEIADSFKQIVTKDPETPFNYDQKLRALENLAKMHGAYAPTKHQRMSLSVTQSLTDLKYQEVIAKLEQIRLRTEQFLKENKQ